MEKTKVDLDQIQKEIKPYLRKGFLQKAYVDSNDVSRICRIFRGKYSNVDIGPKPGDDGKPYLMIKVRQFLLGGELYSQCQVPLQFYGIYIFVASGFARGVSSRSA